MLTPAITASSTSLPATTCSNAVSTQVSLPPLRNWWPLPEAITTGFGLPPRTAGACADANQRRVTATFGQRDGRSLHVRKATVAEPDLLAIYRALGISATPGGTRKLIS